VVPVWQRQLVAFFETRSSAVRRGRVTRAELSYVSGRDPRLWADQALYDDLVASVVAQLGLAVHHRLLEVGCAAGFLAEGLAPRLGQYIGVDLSRQALTVARSLRIPSATFVQADGGRLPFRDGAFDAVVSYDVFTNLPEREVATNLVAEMGRVVRPGGRILVGSVADEARKDELVAAVARVGSELSERCGPLPPEPSRRRWWTSWLPRPPEAEPAISCYYYGREEMVRAGERLGLHTHISDIHPRNPYLGLRFNVVYLKPPLRGA
jgi:SAM-dependent methyltransferase